MRVYLGGVRGSATVSEPDFAAFGGYTTSLLVTGTGGAELILDAGSGLRGVTAQLGRDDPERELLMLLTHFHLDHLAGFPAFGPLYDARRRLVVAAPDRMGRPVEQVLHRLMDKPTWPLQLDAVSARLDFTSLPDKISGHPMPYHEFSVRWCPLPHPGGCTAYRVDEGSTGASLVLATDVEWAAATPEERQDFEALCAAPCPPDLLLLDAHYTAEEYEQFRGWGHSTWQEAVAVARRVGAKEVLLTHHAPTRNDQGLQVIEEQVRAAMPNARLARQGEVVEINGAR